ncbi:MAG: exonuclease SbcCD subunit D C-terminal domain-containing protein [Saprospiraceae bacterium]|nr:exonuclease SbcCD subunit D C-terminal domain-containing protein [Saprospiraceae bacterium]
MKILHTSDWHLGQKFLHFDRTEEHQRALDWLLHCITDQQVDALIVAGDIFDIGNPPNYARRMYYQFLTQLITSPCRHIIIIGGNHDSPAMLNAPAELLKVMNVHILGSATAQPEDQILELKNSQGELEAVVAAVPFLRDRDLHYSLAGEGGADRVDRVKQGIYQHYQQMGDLVQPFGKYDIPKLTTGHLYATGAEASDKQDNIYIGNKENIKASQFPEIFDYVALGHIHRPQQIGGQAHVRYCGSIIPLSFSETKDDKSVTFLHFKGAKLEKLEELPIPTFRRLKTIEGDLPSVKQKIREFVERDERELTPWVEVVVETDTIHPRLDLELQEFVQDMNIELLKIRDKRKHQALQNQVEEPELEDLDAMEVFQKKCAAYGTLPENMEALEQTFKELQSWMTEKDSV